MISFVKEVLRRLPGVGSIMEGRTSWTALRRTGHSRTVIGTKHEIARLSQRGRADRSRAAPP
jgi:hypothetical protein